MLIAITGGTGYIGSRIVHNLKSLHTIIYLNRKKNDSGLSFDLSDTAVLEKNLKFIKADIIIHAGAIARRKECESNPELTEKININATKVITEWALSNDIPIIFMSTNGIRENNVYSNSKKLAENIIKNSGAKYCIMRLSYTFGWSPSKYKPKPLLSIKKEFLSPKSQEFDNCWKFQPTSLNHICDILKILLSNIKEIPSDINIITSDMTTMYDIAKKALPHSVKMNKKLKGRLSYYLTPTNLIHENYPTYTTKMLIDEIKSSIFN